MSVGSEQDSRWVKDTDRFWWCYGGGMGSPEPRAIGSVAMGKNKTARSLHKAGLRELAESTVLRVQGGREGNQKGWESSRGAKQYRSPCFSFPAAMLARWWPRRQSLAWPCIILNFLVSSHGCPKVGDLRNPSPALCPAPHIPVVSPISIRLLRRFIPNSSWKHHIT